MRRLARPGRWDIALGVAIVVVCEIQVAVGKGGSGSEQFGGPTGVGAAVGLALGTCMVWRRRYPRATAIIAFTAMAVGYLLGFSQYDFVGEILTGLFLTYTLGNQVPLRWALACVLYGYVLVELSSPHDYLFNRIGSLFMLSWPLVLGRVVRARQRLIETLEQTTHDLEVSREENAQAAVARERVKIAREMHDVVAHAVSLMVVQAGAAERKLDHQPELARAPIVAIQDAGRQAMADLRRLLEVLRPESEAETATPSAGNLSPQPGLADLDALAESIGGAGLRVEISREGADRALPAGLDLAAFRIVQEALTNALKHADAYVARVSVRFHPDALELEIVDDGRGAAGEPLSAGKFGLSGMRERCAAFGGYLDAGPARAGGYSVRARLPVPTA